MKMLTRDYPEILSAVVMHNGEIIAETPQDDTLYPQYSITKSIVSLAIGMLIAENKLSLSATVGELLHTPETAPLSSVTLEELLTMRSGLNEELLFADRKTCTDYLNPCISKEIGAKRFFYNNANAYLVGRMAEAVIDGNLSDFIRERIFEPLGIEKYEFEYDTEGHFFGASGLKMRTADLAKIGYSMTYGGLYPAQWINEALRPHTVSRDGRTYGYYFWLHPDYYYMSGKWGQRCTIIPAQNAVICVNCEMKVHDYANEYIREKLMPILYTIKA